MFEVFEQYMSKMMPHLLKEEISRIRLGCVTKKMRRKEILLHEGEINRCKIFVAKGLLRNYSIAQNGNEHIVRFTDKDGWTADPESYYTGLPSNYYIDAIEESEVMMWSRGDF